MQMSSNKGFCSFILDSAHEKFDVWNGPNSLNGNLMEKNWEISCLYLHKSRAQAAPNYVCDKAGDS